LCDAHSGFLWSYDCGRIQATAMRGLPPKFAEFVREPRLVEPTTGIGRLARGEPLVHFADLAASDTYLAGDALPRATVDLGGFRTVLIAPLRKDATLLGGFSIERQEVRSFSDKQIALLQNFAAQAVIAMENARLITETRESLEQQTVTTGVLQAISRSAFNLQSVLETLTESAMRLCSARNGVLWLRDGDLFRVRAITGDAPGYLEDFRKHPWTANDASASGRAALTGQVQNVADISGDPGYVGSRLLEKDNILRSLLSVPLMRDDRADGVLTLSRDESAPFTQRQVELVKTFADQAAVALENARLLEAVQQRTRELSQSVAELQALEEVLRAVNSSLDLQTVLSTIIDRAVPLAQADEGTIYEFDPTEEVFVPKAAYGMSDERISRLRERRIRMGETYLGRSAMQRMPVRIDDVQTDQSTPEARELLQGIHAVLAIPLFARTR
jgi:GAF domain-containing protein